MTIQFDGNTGIVTTGNVTANNFFGNFSGNVAVPGVNTEVIFNDNGIANGSLAFTFDKTSNSVTIAGEITTTDANVTGTLLTSTLIAGETTVNGNATINGNLTVSGNVSFIDIERIETEDPMIVVGIGPNGGPLIVNDGRDRGVQMDYYSDVANAQQSAFMGWINSTGNMTVASNVSIANDVVTVNQLGTLEAGEVLAATGNFSGRIDAGYLNSLTTANGQNIYIDPTRTDIYNQNGSASQPFKTIAAAISYAESNDPTRLYSFILAGATYSETIDLNDTTLQRVSFTALGRAIIAPSSGNSFQSFLNNSSLQQLTVRDLTFSSPVVVTGDGTSNQFSVVIWQNVTFASSAEFTSLNQLILLMTAFVTTTTIKNIRYFYLDGAQSSPGGSAVLGVNDSLPIPSLGLSNALYTIYSVQANVSFEIVGALTLSVQINDSRLGVTGQNYTVPTGLTLFSYSSSLRGNWTNNGSMILRNSSSDSAVLGTPPEYLGYFGGSDLSVTGTSNIAEVNSAGNIIPITDNVYSLGNATNQWKDLYVSGNTIYMSNVPLTVAGANTLQIDGANVLTEIGPGGTTIIPGNVVINGDLDVDGNTTLVDLEVTGNANIVGNTITGGILTDNYYYANGAPVDFQQPAGSNTEIQYNSDGDFGASANFTFNETTNVLTVAGNISGANLVTSGGVTATGNITGGNLSTAGIANAGTLEVTGNASVIGNAEIGNVRTQYIYGTSLGSNIVITSTGVDSSVTIVPTGLGSLDVSNKRITSLATPVTDSDAATKLYVDEVAQGLKIKDSVYAGSTAPLPPYVYNNGTAGAGATITANNPGALSLDGTTPGVGERVLIKNEVGANEAYNGVYVVTVAGDGAVAFALTRAADFDNSPTGEVAGAFVFIQQGTTLADSGWVCITDEPVTIGTTPLQFVQFSGAGTYLAGSGLTLTGEVFSVNVDNDTTEITPQGNVVVKPSANFVTPNIGNAVGNSLTLTGNLSAANLIVGNVEITNLIVDEIDANIANITGNITGGNIATLGTANIGILEVTGNTDVVGNISGGNISTAGTANIATLEVTGTADITGNLEAGNVTTVGTANIATLEVTGTADITGNLEAGNVTTVGTANIGTLEVTGNAGVVGNISGGNIATLGTANIGTLEVTGTADITGNLEAGNVTTVGTANIATLEVTGNAGVVGNISGGNIATLGTANIGTLEVTGNTSVSGNANIVGNTATGGILTDNYYYANGAPVDFEQPAGANTELQFNDDGDFGASANLVFNNVTNTLTVTGNVTTGILTATTVGGSLTTNAQPNITSVGTLTSLAVTGNTATGGILTDNYYYANGAPVDFEQPAGSNTQVQYNSDGDFGASANFTFNETTNVLTVTGNIQSNTLGVTGNVTSGNISTGALISTTSINANTLVVSNTMSVGANTQFSANVAITNNLTVGGNVTVDGNINLIGNINEITGNTGVFYGEAGTGFDALYAGIESGFAVLDQTVVQSSGNFNGFVQVNFQNINTGANASTDFVCTADIGNNEAYYINMGIASSTFDGSEPNSLGNVVFPNDGYLYTQDGNMVLGTPSAGKVTKIVTGGQGTDFQVATFNPGGTESTSSTTGALVILGGLGVGSNVHAANIYSTNSFANTANVNTVLNAANINGSNIYGNTLTVTSNVGNIILNPSVVVTLSNKRISDLANPTQNQDAATKIYVDNIAQGLSVKQSCRLGTAAALPAYNYNNGTAGVGATITGLVNGQLSVDSVPVVVGYRILVKDEIGASQVVNGIYVVTVVGDAGTPYVLTRSSDFDNTPEGEIPGSFTFVKDGVINADTGWVCTTNSPVVVGTTPIAFTQFSGAGSYTAGSGLTLTGTVFSVNVDPETTEINGSNQVSVKASANLITPNIGVATGNSLTVTGNVSAANVFATTGIVAPTLTSNVANGTAPFTVTSTTRVANLNVSHANLSDFSGVTTQSSGIFYPTFVNGSGSSNYSLSSNTALSFNAGPGLLSATLLGGTLTTAAQPNITSVGTLANLAVTGNASVGGVLTVTGNISGNNISATANITATGNITTTANITTVNLSTTGNAVIQGNLAVVGKITVSNIDTTDPIFGVGRGPNGTPLTSNDGKDRGIEMWYYEGAPLAGTEKQAFMGWDNSLNKMLIARDVTISPLEVVTVNNFGTTVVGVLEASSADLSGNIVAGNVTSNALTTTNTLSVTANANIGNIGVSGLVTVTGNITGGNVNGGNLVTANFFTGTLTTAAQPNITSVGTLTGLGVTGNITGGNVNGGNLVTANFFTGTLTTAAQPNVTSVGTLTSLAVTGNVTTGNVSGTTGAFTNVSGNGSALTSLNASNISSGTLDQARLANASLTVNGTSITLGSSGTVTANAQTLTGTSLNSTVTGSSLTSVGTLGSLSVSGTATVGTVQTSTLTTGASGTAGSITGNWTLTSGSRLEATYADLAERYRSDEQYEPGTILMIGGTAEVTIANKAGQYRLAGIVSTAPAYVLNSTIPDSVIVALTGRVPCRVVGKIQKGDLITISDIPGVGTSVAPPASGTVVGRALENYDSTEVGVIEVKVDQC
jgi:hypothetical protein